MSKADEMLENLGYHLEMEGIHCNNVYKRTNDFDEESRIYFDFYDYTVYFKTEEDRAGCTMSELKAIYEKCKEYKWI